MRRREFISGMAFALVFAKQTSAQTETQRRHSRSELRYRHRFSPAPMR
jgi:hypothetical protein